MIGLPIEQVEALGYKHLGSRWYEGIEWQFIRLRQWPDNEFDVWLWHPTETERQIVFRGKIFSQDELRWVLSRVIPEEAAKLESTPLPPTHGGSGFAAGPIQSEVD